MFDNPRASGGRRDVREGKENGDEHAREEAGEESGINASDGWRTVDGMEEEGANHTSPIRCPTRSEPYTQVPVNRGDDSLHNNRETDPCQVEAMASSQDRRQQQKRPTYKTRLMSTNSWRVEIECCGRCVLQRRSTDSRSADDWTTAAEGKEETATGVLEGAAISLFPSRGCAR